MCCANASAAKARLALPIIDEPELGRVLQSLTSQTTRDFSLVICVNQPESWWSDPSKQASCRQNQKTLSLLRHQEWPFDVRVIDRSSPGNGWTGKQGGVGWARKVAMEAAVETAQGNDVLLSVDADTYYPPDFVQKVVDQFVDQPKQVALAAPYEHPLTGEEILDRAMLRYEFYLRTYFCELLHSGSVFAFTALGSAMACTVKAYRAIGGMTPKKAGEDFYFLQKLCKYGPISLWLESEVVPATRLSDRVAFGTGPALIKGVAGEWRSYPVYDPKVWQEVRDTIASFDRLYNDDLDTPMTAFLQQQLNTMDIWGPMRRNAPSQSHFIRACHERVDGLRILQYHHYRHNRSGTDEERLYAFFKRYLPEFVTEIDWSALSFANSTLEQLVTLRARLKEYDNRLRQTHHHTGANR